MVDPQVPQQIRILPVLGAGFAQLLLGVDGLQSHEPHKPADSLGVYQVPLAPQPECHLRDAIKGNTRKLFVDQVHQSLVVALILLGLIVI